MTFTPHHLAMLLDESLYGCQWTALQATTTTLDQRIEAAIAPVEWKRSGFNARLTPLSGRWGVTMSEEGAAHWATEAKRREADKVLVEREEYETCARLHFSWNKFKGELEKGE